MGRRGLALAAAVRPQGRERLEPRRAAAGLVAQPASAGFSAAPRAPPAAAQACPAPTVTRASELPQRWSPSGPAGGAWPEAWQALARVAPPPLRPCMRPREPASWLITRRYRRTSLQAAAPPSARHLVTRIHWSLTSLHPPSPRRTRAHPTQHHQPLKRERLGLTLSITALADAAARRPAHPSTALFPAAFVPHGHPCSAFIHCELAERPQGVSVRQLGQAGGLGSWHGGRS